MYRHVQPTTREPLHGNQVQKHKQIFWRKAKVWVTLSLSVPIDRPFYPRLKL
jgi:hypothetical protein